MSIRQRAADAYIGRRPARSVSRRLRAALSNAREPARARARLRRLRSSEPVPSPLERLSVLEQRFRQRSTRRRALRQVAFWLIILAICSTFWAAVLWFGVLRHAV